MALLRPDERITKDVALQAKMQLELNVRHLMPGGNPTYAEIRKYPSIVQLMPLYGEGTMHKVMFMMVYDFCRSINVVRNMDDSQMVEAAGYLLDECGNFRLEDYVCMFAMAKRGMLVKVLDRMDIQVIGQMSKAYAAIREAAGEALQVTEFQKHEAMINRMEVADNHIVDKAIQEMKAIPKDVEPPKAIQKPFAHPERGEEILKHIDLSVLKPKKDATK